MKKPRKPVFFMLFSTGIILAIFLIMQPLQVWLFGKEISVLFPKGWVGLEQRNLLLIIQAIMLLVIIPVYIFTFIFSWKYRAGPDNKNAVYDPELEDNMIAEVIWWGVPIILVAIISVLTWVKTHELDPYRPLVSDKKALQIDVVALQWKWLFIYPEEGIATVNYFKFPKNTPLHFQITADAPMNSFWLPDLGGQIYAMPGMKTQLFLIANQLGQFRGSSANISGEGFASMHFIAEASSEEDYQAWVKSVRESDKKLNKDTYKELAAPDIRGVELYQLEGESLLNHIIMKYMMPQPPQKE